MWTVFSWSYCFYMSTEYLLFMLIIAIANSGDFFVESVKLLGFWFWFPADEIKWSCSSGRQEGIVN